MEEFFDEELPEDMRFSKKGAKLRTQSDTFINTVVFRKLMWNTRSNILGSENFTRWLVECEGNVGGKLNVRAMFSIPTASK